MKTIETIQNGSERQKALISILNTSNMVTKSFETVLAPHQLTIAQYEMLVSLQRQYPSPVSVDKMVTASDVWVIVWAVEATGYVKLLSATENGEVITQLLLTQKGLNTLNLIALQKEELEKPVSAITDFELALFNKLLQKMMGNGVKQNSDVKEDTKTAHAAATAFQAEQPKEELKREPGNTDAPSQTGSKLPDGGGPRSSPAMPGAPGNR